MRGDLAIQNLVVRFNEKTVFDRFSLDVPEGTFVSIMGPSGSGKTTLLRVMMGLIKPDAGTVVGFTGKRRSAVFQENRLCENLSVRANLRLAAPRSGDRRLMSHLASLGLEGALHQPIRTLSGGMQRRVALARALLADYQLLFLDEPFTGLDDATRVCCAAFLRSQTAGKTVFLVTHDEETARALSDRIVVLQ